jgi:hypothetical protein
MAMKTVFEDEDNNEMNCFLNDKGKVYIGVGQRGEDMVYSGFITLDKEDVGQLIKILTDCQNEMED